jgi:histone H2A
MERKKAKKQGKEKTHVIKKLGPKFIKLDLGIHRISKQVHPDARLSVRALSMLNDLARAATDMIIHKANMVLHHTSRTKLDSRIILIAARLALPGELAKHGVSELTKAITVYNAAQAATSTRERSEKQAKLQLPVAKFSNYVRAHSAAPKQGVGAGIAMAAVLEYLLAELLELGGNAARDLTKGKHTIIRPRHLMLAIRNDEELNQLFKRVYLGGGVMQHIYQVLLPKKKQKKHKSGEY